MGGERGRVYSRSSLCLSLQSEGGRGCRDDEEREEVGQSDAGSGDAKATADVMAVMSLKSCTRSDG